MAIATSCGECGRDYSLKDELAGKKFKCKNCGAVVVVPAPRKSASPKSSGSTASSKKSPSSATPTRPAEKKSHDDDFLEALNSSGLEEGDDDHEEEEELRPVAKKKSTAKKKKKSASSGSGGMLAKVGGGLFTALIVIGFILRLFRAAGGVGGGASWQDFTPPDGRYTVTFPNVAKMKPAAEPGASTYLAETRNFACAVTYAKLPAGSGAMLAQLPPQVLSDQLTQVAFPGQQPLTNRPATLAGRPSQETSFDKLGMRLTERSLIIGDELFNCEFVSKGDPPLADFNKFFDSFRINGAGGNAAVSNPPAANPAAVNMPVAARNPASPTSGNYQQRRKTFQTKLMKSGPAPQEYQNETPPPGVQVVTYPSGQLQLKAWVSVPNGAAGSKAPALVFFHGGFAFGADDLEACRPAMTAGMVVMAPMLRGENGNPGNYELFMGEIDDARAAVQWLSAQSYVDPKRIYTFGHSIGGGVSAVLSLFDDVPIQHGGSSGGLYFESVFAAWQSDGSVPFDMRNPEERRLRLLAGNMRDMRHKHFAYLGAADTMSLFTKDAKTESSGSMCQILSVPGDHMTSFEPSLRQYLQVIQSGQ